MDLTTAAALARQLMAEHGLTDAGWWFAFDNAEKRLGLCDYSRKRISMSRHMVRAAEEELVHQTMLHEIAHALVGQFDSRGKTTGHGQAWKLKAASIGYTGKRTSANPHVEQQRAAQGLPPRPTRTSTPDPAFRRGDRVRLTNGVTGTFIKPARTRYHVAGDDGQTWTAPFGSLTKLTTAERPAVAAAAAAPAVELLRRGAQVAVVAGQKKYQGRTARILSVGPSRYKIRFDDNGEQVFAPFRLVKAV